MCHTPVSTVTYHIQGSNHLTVVIGKACNLFSSDSSTPVSSYVKIEIHPLSGHDNEKEAIKKTQVVSRSCNPEYSETFQWHLPSIIKVHDHAL